MSKIVSLADMEQGAAGTIVDIEGGYGIRTSLNNMGIRIGTKIKKIFTNDGI